MNQSKYIYLFKCRYKLDVEVEAEGFRTTFVFWDRECNELLGKTAAQLHMEMIEVRTHINNFLYCYLLMTIFYLLTSI
jgi:hypothetical protein